MNYIPLILLVVQIRRADIKLVTQNVKTDHTGFIELKYL